MQAENLGFLPRLRIGHTSETAFGQIYIPIVNWLLMFTCIAVVLFFRTSSNLVSASDQPGMALWREQLYTFLRRNAANPAGFFCLPPARVFEIGTAIEM